MKKNIDFFCRSLKHDVISVLVFFFGSLISGICSILELQHFSLLTVLFIVAFGIEFCQMLFSLSRFFDALCSEEVSPE